jgi:hypothetical protein
VLIGILIPVGLDVIAIFYASLCYTRNVRDLRFIGRSVLGILQYKFSSTLAYFPVMYPFGFFFTFSMCARLFFSLWLGWNAVKYNPGVLLLMA